MNWLRQPDPPVDPARFGDPLAQAIEWKPLRKGGTNFRTHKLIQISPDRIEFVATLGAKLFALLFVLMGGFLLAVISFTNLMQQTADTERTFLFPVAMGLLVCVGGGIYLYRTVTPIVFDKQTGRFWKGRNEPGLTMPIGANDAALGEIRALQIVSEYCSGGKNSNFYSYELNLVLADARRLSVMDHGNLPSLQGDTALLSTFLNVPVWDATIQSGG